MAASRDGASRVAGWPRRGNSVTSYPVPTTNNYSVERTVRL